MNHKDYNIINLEFKGTKGPWKYIHQNHATKQSGQGQRYAVMAHVINYLTRPEERFVYNIKLDKTQDLNLHREAEANAMLISAAPDLLEACDDLLQYWLGTYGESYVTEAAQVAISKAIGKPYKEIAQAKTDCINESINVFDLLSNKLQHACNLMNQMYETLSEVGRNIVDLTDVEDFLRENDKNIQPVQEDDSDLELPF